MQQLNAFKYFKWLNISIWPIDCILTGTGTPGQTGPASNGNEWVLYTPHNFRTGTPPSDAV